MVKFSLATLAFANFANWMHDLIGGVFIAGGVFNMMRYCGKAADTRSDEPMLNQTVTSSVV